MGSTAHDLDYRPGTEKVKYQFHFHSRVKKVSEAAALSEVTLECEDAQLQQQS